MNTEKPLTFKQAQDRGVIGMVPHDPPLPPDQQRARFEAKERLVEVLRQDTHLNSAGRYILAERLLAIIDQPTAPACVPGAETRIHSGVFTTDEQGPRPNTYQIVFSGGYCKIVIARDKETMEPIADIHSLDVGKVFMAAVEELERRLDPASPATSLPPAETQEGQWSREAQLVRQEKLTSALWGFAHDLQHEPHNAKCADGTTVNLAAVGRAQEIILGIFNQNKISIQ